MNLMEMLQGAVDDQFVEKMSNELGAEKSQTSTAMNSAFAAILNGLTKNAASPGGADALLQVLDRDHDGSIFNDLSGFILGQKQPENPSMVDGAGIIKHALGSNAGSIVESIAKMSGIDQGKALQLLVSAAPMVMGMLGKAKQQTNANAGGLMDILSNTTKQTNAQNEHHSILQSLLDKDGDGSIMDDLLAMGGKSILGGLFKK